MRAGLRAARCRSTCASAKLRGSTSKDAYPVGPFRTYTHPVNVRDLDRFEAGDEVARIARREGHPQGTKIDEAARYRRDLEEALWSGARDLRDCARRSKRQAAQLLREPKVRKKPKHHSKPAPAPEPEEPAAEAAAEEAPAEEAAADAEAPADAAEAPEAAEEP
jgi:hypothetical protein